MSQTTIAGSQTRLRQSTNESTPRNPFAQLDEQITEVSERIWTRQPYLLTIPSQRPYHRHATDPARWYMNTPFSRKEEQLQYMSLLTHQGDDETLLHVDGSIINEDGTLPPPLPAPSPISEQASRPQTPVETAPRKKISLKDYKSKDRSAAQTPEGPPSSADMRKQAIKSHKEEQDIVRQANPVKKEPTIKIERTPQSLTSLPGLPFKRDDPIAQPSTATHRDRDSLRPAKKRRLSEEEKKPILAGNTKIAERERVVKKTLPDLLSPEMPVADKKSKPRGLPSLLSPKLPPSLEKATAAPPRTEEVKSILKTLDSPVRLNEKKKETAPNRARSESQTSARPGTPGIKVSSPAPKPVVTPASKPVPASPLSRVASPKPRQRHTIVLKYGKKNVKRVQALLKFQPRPQKKPASRPEPERAPALKQPARLDSVPVAKKRPPEITEDVPVKKPRLASQDSAISARPSTPKLDLSSRSPLPGPKPKTSFSTPKKDSQLKSSAMQRVASTDTIEARTPQETGRLSTPVGQANRKQSPAPVTTPAKVDTHAAWNEMQERIFQLGRVLKKEGSQLVSESAVPPKQLGVVSLIEALLCFMIRSAVQGQMHSRDPGYDTIIPYFNMVYNQSRQFRHLHGLVILLGAVIRQHMHHEHLKRLAKYTHFEDPVSAPTPGSDGVTKGNEDASKRQKSFVELRDELVQNAAHLKNAWLEGSKQLSCSVIEDSYTSTWLHKSRDYGKRNPDRLNPGDLGKEYYLPLDVSSSCFEATNFSLEFLREWTMLEGVPWKARIEL